MKILLADDARDMRMIVPAILRKWGYEVVTAEDGQEAWEILQQEPIPFVISDWMMPNMDGIELCRRIRDADFEHYTYTILLTGRDDKASLVEGMEAGADDFLVKPVDREELRVRIRAGERIIHLESELASKTRKIEAAHQELSEAYATIKDDLESAASMQTSLLPPPATIQNVAMDWVFKPSALVSGDMFGYFPLGRDHLGFYQLDVSGHGVQSALLSFTLNKVMSPAVGGEGLLQRDDGSVVRPADVVAELNRRFQSGLDSSLYFTMAYGVLEASTGNTVLAQAGHPAPILTRANGDSELLGHGGFPVGMLPDMDYGEIEVKLSPGDRLAFYSDGITECESPDGELFSEERLVKLLDSSKERPLAELKTTVTEAMLNWKGDDKYTDDVSILTMERQK